MKQLHHVVLAALLHDIGKFFERGELLAEYRSNEDQQQIDCPYHHEGRYWSHKHSLHTRRFCEELAKTVPILQPEEYQRSKSADQHWINLAARHHVAAGAPLEVLVQQADHLASSERESGNYYENRIHQKTLMESMLERVNLRDQNITTEYRLPLAESNPLSEHIVPATVSNLGLQKRQDGIWLHGDSLATEYEVMGKSMLADLKKMPQAKRSDYNTYYAVISSLLAIFERYLSQVPAATNIQHADISLFDHLRITAAVAEGLYCHHQHTKTLSNTHAIQSDKSDKWRLVCGDFSGIQSFIYGITAKGAAKALRGRSLYIQLLCDAVSEYLLRSLELYPTARIYSSGGKFYLLIADCLEQRLRMETERVNDWLLKEFGGDIYLGIGVAKVCDTDFCGGEMSVKWKEANDSLMRDRNRRFASQMDEAFFAPRQPLDKGAHCEVCGRSDAGTHLENDRICRQCQKLESLGQRIADAEYMFWVWGEDAVQFDQPPLCRLPFDGLACTLYLLKSAPTMSKLVDLPASRLERINHADCLNGNVQGYACGSRWLGRWDRRKDSGDWEFDQFAQASNGVARFGVLRMDVDNLGQLFIRGFRWADDRSMGSLSRVATLSRQLNLFFSGYLMRLIEKESRVQVIYAGGDDLFLIGSWDALPAVARQIEQAFCRYAAQNPDFTISAGMSMVRGKYPISHAAEMAGNAEGRAKSLSRQVADKKCVKKSAFCLLDVAIGWEDFDAVTNFREQLNKTATINKAILGRMREVVLAQQEYVRLERGRGVNEISIADLVQWQKWRWQLVYNLHRYSGRNSDMKPLVEFIRKAVLGNDLPGRASDMAVIEWLQLPTRWAEFLLREVK